MGPADALSRKDEVEIGDDNWEITLLKGKDQWTLSLSSGKSPPLLLYICQSHHRIAQFTWD